MSRADEHLRAKVTFQAIWQIDRRLNGLIEKWQKTIAYNFKTQIIRLILQHTLSPAKVCVDDSNAAL